MINAGRLLPMAHCRKPPNKLSMTSTWGVASGGRSARIGSKRCGSLDGEIGDFCQASLSASCLMLGTRRLTSRA